MQSKYFRLSLFLSLLLAIAGCRTAPEHYSKLSVAAPGSFSETSTNDVSSAWLATFNDDQLADVVKQAQLHNHNLKAAGARLLAAHANARINRASQLPTVSGRASASRNKRNAAGGFRIASPRTDQLDINFTLAWELDVWGKLANRSAAAGAEYQAVEADLQLAKLSLAANTAKAWFNAVEAELQLRLAKRTSESFKNNLEIVEQEFQRGTREALDLRLTRANAASADASMAARMRQRDAAARLLETLMGDYPKNAIAITTNLPPLETTVPAGLPSELLHRRPDIRAAERRAAAAMERFHVSRKDMLPTIALTTTAGTSSRELEDIFDLRQNVWSLASNATQPIFQGGRLRAAKEQARANHIALLEGFNQIVLDAFREVETTLAAEDYLSSQAKALDISAKESIEAEEIAWSQYRRGLVDIITVLEAQRRSVSAQSSLIGIRNQQLQNRIDLHLALAGDFQDTTAEEASSQETALSE